MRNHQPAASPIALANGPSVTRLDGVEVRRHVFDARSGTLSVHVPTAKYIAAKIPFSWMWHAHRLPGKTAHVALALWFLFGVKKSHTFKLTAEAADLAGCGRKALYAALTSLRQAGLISMVHRSGARPMITLIPPLLPKQHSQTEGD